MDLFAGAGGFSWGLHQAGFLSTVGVDFFAPAVETLEGNFGHLGMTPLLRDLAIFTPDQLKYELEHRGKPADFEVIVGGPPCQGWSRVGRAKMRSLDPVIRLVGDSADPRNKLFRTFLSYVKFFKPQVCILENVPGMTTCDGLNHADLIGSELSSVGYLVSMAILNAVNFGVPQHRERVFIVGVRSGLGVIFEFPPSTGVKVTVRKAIADLPPVESGSLNWIMDYQPKRRMSGYAMQMRNAAVPDKIFDHVGRRHNPQDKEAFRLLSQGGKYRDLPKRLRRYRDDIFDDKYHKLIWNAPSWCITAHLGKDGYSHIHPEQARTITIREAARLQSFPDSYYFAGNLGEKFRQIGNAVPPLLAWSIGKAVLQQIDFSCRTSKRAEQFHARNRMASNVYGFHGKISHTSSAPRRKAADFKSQ